MRLYDHGYGNGLFRDHTSGLLNATGDEPVSSTGFLRDSYMQNFGLYVPRSDSILYGASDLTTLSAEAKKDNSWLNQLLGIVNAGVSGYFNAEATKASQTLTADEIAKVIQGYQQQAEAEQAAKKARTTTTLIIAGIVLVALAVGAYFLFRKK